MSKKFLEDFVKKGDTVVDGTLGNGHDALFLARLIGVSGKVIGFDIQEKAIKKSQGRMKKEGFSNYLFLNESHHKIDTYVEEASVVVFNLGYLPGSSKEITTKSETTLEAVKKTLQILKKPGMVSIMFYTGHPGGIEERDKVTSFVSKLDKRKYEVLEIKQINGKESAPFLLIIYKKEE